MRELHLYLDRQRGVCAESTKSSVVVTTLSAFQNDTLRLCVHGGLARPSPDVVSLKAYTETAWSFDALRASVSLVDPATESTDLAPEKGTFKLTVDGDATAWLAWPETTEEIAAFKAAVLAALNALPAVDGGLAAADPADAPLHTLHFAWIDATDTRAIEVTGLRLIPPVESEVGVTQASPTVQYVKLTQLPVVIVDSFAFPTPPAASIATERAGGAGVNAVQLLTVPADGAFDLTWDGSRTIVLPCAGLSAATLASALNTIVTDGDTAPGFAVTARSSTSFAVEFIGSLAAAAQDDLVATMRQAASSLYAVATLPLTSKRFERALNGARKITCRFELVIDSAENTFQLDFVILNDATGPGTVSASEPYILTDTRTVYVDSGLGTPFVEAAPGFSFVPPAAGSALAITHGLGTWEPVVHITLHTVDHGIFAADPSDLAAALTGSRNLDDTEYGQSCSSENITTITLPWALVNDPTNPLDYRLLKVRVSSPEAQILMFEHQHSWDDVLASLPGGMTLTDKLAAIDAALGMIGGSLIIPGASLVAGSVAPAKLDLAALVAALVARADFLAALRLLIKDPDLIANLITALTTNTALATVLESLITALIVAIENSTTLNNRFAEMLVALFTGNTTVNGLIREQLISILQGGGALPDGVLLFQPPDVAFDLPGLNVISGVTLYTPLPVAFALTTAGSTITGDLSPGTNAERRLVTGTARAPAGNGRAAQTFAAGTEIAWNTRFWQAVVASPSIGTFEADAGTELLTFAAAHGLVAGDILRFSTSNTIPGGLAVGTSYYVIASGLTTTALKVSTTLGGGAVNITSAGTGTHTAYRAAYYPAEYELPLLAPIAINEQQLAPSTQLLAIFSPQLQLATSPRAAEATTGLIRLVIETAQRTVTAGGHLNLAALAWVTLKTVPIALGASLDFHRYEVRVTRAANGVLTTKVRLDGQAEETVTSPASANFVLRARLTQFDVENNTDPRGSLLVRCVDSAVTIAPTA